MVNYFIQPLAAQFHYSAEFQSNCPRLNPSCPLSPTPTMPPITHLGQFGTNDFIEYWTAFRLFLAQDNPYDPERMLLLQTQLGWTAQNPLMMWNPPWLLLLLSPILLWDFGTAASIWLAINVVFVGLTVFFTLDLLNIRRRSPAQYLIAISLAFTFFPLYNSLKVGQLGGLLGLACLGGIWGIIRRRYGMAAVFLPLWSIKAHLFLPLATLLFFRSIRHRHLWQAMIPAGALLGILILVSELIHPHAIAQWLAGVKGGQVGDRVEGVDQWIGASLTGGVRLLFARGEMVPVWPMIIVPAIGVCIVAILAIRSQKSDVFSELSILTILISACFAPFGWVFDLAILVPVYLLCVLEGLQGNASVQARCAAALVVLVQIGGWIQYWNTDFRGHHHFIWMPLVTGLGCGCYAWSRMDSARET